MNRKISLVAFLGICVAASVWLLVVAGFVYGIVYWYFRPQFVVTSAVNFDQFLSTGNITFPSFPLRDQAYAVSLELELPRSTNNQALGTFACYMNLNGKGQTEAQKMTMAMLPFKSPLIDLLDQVVFAPLYIFGFKSQVELLRLEMFDFIKTPFDSLRLKINKQLDIASATLVWSTKLHGFRKLMYHHPLSTCFVCVGALWFVGLIVTITIGLLVHLKLDAGTSGDTCPTQASQRLSKYNPNWAAEYLASPDGDKAPKTPPLSPKSPEPSPKLRRRPSRSPRPRIRSQVRTPRKWSRPSTPDSMYSEYQMDTLPTVHNDFNFEGDK